MLKIQINIVPITKITAITIITLYVIAEDDHLYNFALVIVIVV